MESAEKTIEKKEVTTGNDSSTAQSHIQQSDTTKEQDFEKPTSNVSNSL